MIVNNKYRLGALVRSGEVATFEAQEMASGRSLYVHLMAGAPAAASLAAQVRQRLAAGSSSPLIEQGDYEGAPFVVTEATPDLLDLRRWIEGGGAPAIASAEPGEGGRGASIPAGESHGEPGEFTKLFQGPGGGASDTPRPAAGTGSPRPNSPASTGGTGGGFEAELTPPKAPQGEASRQTPGREPGEFTKLFAGSGAPAEKETKPAAPEAPAAPAVPAGPPGGSAEVPRDTAPSAGSPPAGGPQEGEFTRIFRESQAGGPPAGSGSSARPDTPAGPGSPAASAPEHREPPAFPSAPVPPVGTAREASSPAPPPAAGHGDDEDEFLRLFGGQGPGQKTADPPAIPAPPRRDLTTESPAAARTPQPPEIGTSGTVQSGFGTNASFSGTGSGSGSAAGKQGKEYGGPGTSQTGEFEHLFQPRARSSGAREPASPPTAAELGVTESGLRRMSPEERRQEMRQFRMVSRPAEEQPEGPSGKAPEARSLPPDRPLQPPASPPAQPDPASGRQPGEFTKLFQSGPAASAPQPPPAPPGHPAPAPPAGSTDRRSATQLGGPGEAPSGDDPLSQRPPGAGRSPGRDWTTPPGPAPAPPGSGAFASPYDKQAVPGGEPPQAGQAGEFTKLFRQGKPSPGKHEPLPPPAPQAPPAASPGAGEFTRLFGSGMSGPSERDPWGARPQAPPPQSDPWSEPPRQSTPAQGSEPGSFTRLFGGGGGGASPPGRGAPGGDPFSGGSSWPGDSQPQMAEPEQHQGEFTKLFGGKASPGSAGSGNWNEERNDPRGATQISHGPAKPPQAPPAAPPAQQGPSEYTRMMGNAPPPPRQQGPLPQQGMPAEQQAAAPPQMPAAPPAYPAAYAPPAYAPPAAAPPPVAAPPPAALPPQPAAAQPAAQRPEREGTSDRSMYLILALLFCALLVVALGIVLFVSMTGDRGEQAVPAAQTQEVAPQASGGNPLSGVTSSGSVPGVYPGSVSSPSVSGPSVYAPSVSSSGISSGSVTAPSVSGAHVSAPSVSRPSMPIVPRASSGQMPAASITPQASGQPAAESSGTPFLALIIILSVLLVIAVGAAVFFALRRA